MTFRTKARRVWWLVNGISEPHPLGPEHWNTATSSCAAGRHHLCSGRVLSLLGRPPRNCSCPHHRHRGDQ